MPKSSAVVRLSPRFRDSASRMAVFSTWASNPGRADFTPDSCFSGRSSISIELVCDDQAETSMREQLGGFQPIRRGDNFILFRKRSAEELALPCFVVDYKNAEFH
jgi:hypothetical protein